MLLATNTYTVVTLKSMPSVDTTVRKHVDALCTHSLLDNTPLCPGTASVCKNEGAADWTMLNFMFGSLNLVCYKFK